MKTAAMSLWTAICLALLECVICVIVAELLYLVEGSFTQFGSGVEGVSVHAVIVRDNLVILLGRAAYGFVPVTALALFLCRTWNRPLDWELIGAINVVSLLLMFAITENRFQFLQRLLHPARPLYENIVHLLVLSSFFSPILLSKAKLWGSVLPAILSR